MGILAKIKNQGIDNLKTFIEKVDGIVIARGDMGVEISDIAMLYLMAVVG